MEVSKSKTLYSSAYPSSKGYTLTAYLKENSTDTPSNSSNITIKASLTPNGQYWTSSYNSKLELFWHDNRTNTDVLKHNVEFAGLSGFSDKKELVITFDVEHKSDGTLSGYAKAVFTKGSTTSSNAPASGDVSTDNTALTAIPRQATLKTAPDFTDEGNPTITYENKAGNSVTSLWAGIYNTAGTVAYAAYRDISKTGSSYTFNLTTTERNALRNAIPTSNSLQVKFYVTTVIGSNTYYSTLTKTMTLVNGNPTFSNFDFEDTNTTTTALTGNNQYCVVGYSNIKATISTANKATANKGANMTSNGAKYRFTIGSNTPVDITYSSSASVNGTINNASSGTFVMYATDSRGNTTSVTKLAAVVKNYTNIYLNPTTSSIVRNNNGIGTGATLTLKGTIWNESFGSVTNTIKSVTYRLKKTTSSSWSDGTTSITPTVSGNNFTFSGLIAGDESTTWNINDSYNVQITITDELSTTTLDLILNSGTPTMALAKGGVAIKGKYDTTVGGSLQVDGQRWNQRNIAFMYINAVTTMNIAAAWTAYKVPLNNCLVYGNFAHWDSTNKRLVLDKPATALKFSVGYDWYNNLLNGDRSFGIYKNGTNRKSMGYVNYGTSSYTAFNSEAIVTNFSAGDYFELYVSAGNSGTETLFAYNNYLIVELIE